MANAMSLDNQTFLSWLVDSFINFFQLQNFRLFLYFSFISSGGWDLEVTVFWEGQTVGGGGGQLTLVQYVL